MLDFLGIVVDPETNEEMTLRDAVVRGLIYKDSVIYDVETMRLITLERAIKSGMIDGRTGRLVWINNKDLCLKQTFSSPRFRIFTPCRTNPEFL